MQPTLGISTLSLHVAFIEIAGTIFILLLGSALHFTYKWSGKNPIVAIFSAKNESVWEHLKMAFWPACLWMVITAFPFRNEVNNFFPAKAASIFLMLLLIPIVYCTYTAFSKKNILAVDISIFISIIVVGQVVSFVLFGLSQVSAVWTTVAGLAMVGLAAAFVVFTFYPPHLPLFQDPSLADTASE